MAKSKKPRKKSTNYKKVQRILKGVIMGWSVEDPLKHESQIIDTQITHRNAYYKLMVPHIAKDIKAAIDKYAFKYKVAIECEFKDAHEKQYFRGADLVISGFLANADGHYQQAIEEIFEVANMDHYITTHVTAEIIGAGEIREEDFAA